VAASLANSFSPRMTGIADELAPTKHTISRDGDPQSASLEAPLRMDLPSLTPTLDSAATFPMAPKICLQSSAMPTKLEEFLPRLPEEPASGL